MATTADPELRSRRVNYWRMKSVFTFAELVLQRLFVATWNRASETEPETSPTADASPSPIRGPPRPPWTSDAAAGAALRRLVGWMGDLNRQLMARVIEGDESKWDVSLLAYLLTRTKLLRHDRRAVSAVKDVWAERNKYAHSSTYQLSVGEFDRMRNQLRTALVTELGASQAEFDGCFLAPLDDLEAMMAFFTDRSRANQAAELELEESDREMSTKRFDDAAARCAKALERLAGTVSPVLEERLLLQSARAKLRLGDANGAVKDADAAVQLGTVSPDAHGVHGEALLRMGKLNRARSELGLAIAQLRAGQSPTLEERLAPLLGLAEECNLRLNEDARQNRQLYRLAPPALLDAADNLLHTQVPSFPSLSSIRAAGAAIREDRPLDAKRDLLTAVCLDRNNPIAQCALGVLFYCGLRGKPLFNDAAKWLQLAAAHDDSVAPAGLLAQYRVAIGNACLGLGNLHHGGEASDVPRDPQRAAQLWRRAAELGSPGGANNAGVVLWQGLAGIPVDVEQAHDLFEVAVGGRCAEAEWNLAELHASE